MLREADYETLVADIYEAGVEPSLWERAVERAADVLSCFAVHVSLFDMARGTAVFSTASGYDPADQERYFTDYVGIDPRIALAFRTKAGEMFACHNHFDADFVARDRFFQEFLIPVGGRFVAGGRLKAVGGVTPILAFHRNTLQGPCLSADVEDFGRLAPHFRRAAHLTATLGAERTLRLPLAAALDRMPYGVLVVDAHSRALHVNRAAEAIIRRQDGLRLGHAGLVAFAPEQTAALRALIADACATALGRGAGGGAMRVARKEGRAAYEATVTPLSVRAELSAGFTAGAALVFLHDPEASTEAPLDRLRRLYRLSRGEAKLAQQLMAGQSVERSAEILGIAPVTVRTVLHRLFVKTGTSRQSELVRLLVRGLAPLS